MTNKLKSKSFFEKTVARIIRRRKIRLLGQIYQKVMYSNDHKNNCFSLEIIKRVSAHKTYWEIKLACQCIRDLGMPFFNHEVVKKALVMAMEKKNDRMLDLLQECFGEGLITTNQMTKGFSRIKDGMDDLALDIPNAEEKYEFYLEHAKKRGWLVPTFGSGAVDAC